MDPRLWELVAEGEHDDEVPAVVRLGRADALPPHLRPVTQFGMITTVRVRRGTIPQVRSDPAVVSMKAAEFLAPEPVPAPNDALAEFDDGLRPSDHRRPQREQATGRGVVVGVVDWGFDIAHPEFRHPDGRTRLLALWDQSARGGPRNRYGYGSIHDADAINRALASPDPYRALGYHPGDSDPTGDGAHGTHVASIAAGNGRSGGPSGVAPEADLVFVQLSTFGPEGNSPLGDSVTLIEAIDFIAATAGARPWVINLSMGRHGGQHDGTTLVEQALDAVLREQPGRALVQSCGNYYDRQIHSAGQLRPGEQRLLCWQIDASDTTPNECEIWYSGSDVLRVGVRSPDGRLAQWLRQGERMPLIHNERTVGAAYHRVHEPNNLDNQIVVILDPQAPAGAWEIALEAENVVDGRFDAWIERDAVCPGCQSRFHPDDDVPTSTIGTICNGFRTIAVGAYNAHTPERPIAPFSSAGKTRDGRLKPDVVAPGVGVLAARSTPRGGAPAARLTRKSGTSMAAPHVTGTIALMFEVAPRRLRIEETHNLLLSSSQRIVAEPPLAYRVGSGYLAIDAAVQAARMQPRELGTTLLARPAAVEATADDAEQHADCACCDHATYCEEHDMINNSADETLGFDEIDPYADAPAPFDAVAEVCDGEADWAAPAPQEPDTPAEGWDEEPAALALIDCAGREQDSLFEVGEADAAAVPLGNALLDEADALLADGWHPWRADELLAAALTRVAQADAALPTEHPTPAAAELFRAFTQERHAELGELAQHLRVVAGPGEQLADALQPGDVLVRVVPGEGGQGHIALVADPATYAPHELSAAGLVPEGQLPGGYAQVVEGGLRPHGRDAGFARRIIDGAGRMPYDQLLLRVDPYQPYDAWEHDASEAGSSVREAFEAAVRARDWRTAYLNLNGLNMTEMLTALDAIGQLDREALWAERANHAGMINLPRIAYAVSVVTNRVLPAPVGDLEATGQVAEAASFIADKLLPVARAVNRDARDHLALIVQACQQHGIADKSHIAYVLASAHHESRMGRTMTELASCRGYEGRHDLGNTQPGDGPRFKGRGYVQLTGRRNYTRYSQIVGVDLVAEPTRATDPPIAARILAHGMQHGSFTGRSLADFGADPAYDFVQARRIVNGLDRADAIAAIARRYRAALQ
jgi:subtilisin family serine protease/predicted chitinase